MDAVKVRGINLLLLFFLLLHLKKKEKKSYCFVWNCLFFLASKIEKYHIDVVES